MADLQNEAKIRVVNFFNDFRLDGVEELTLDGVSIIWFSKTVNSWKAVVATTLPEDIYYEVTYDNETKETHLDVYTKMYSFVISDQEATDPNQLSFDVI